MVQYLLLTADTDTAQSAPASSPSIGGRPSTTWLLDAGPSGAPYGSNVTRQQRNVLGRISAADSAAARPDYRALIVYNTSAATGVEFTVPNLLAGASVEVAVDNMPSTPLADIAVPVLPDPYTAPANTGAFAVPSATVATVLGAMGSGEGRVIWLRRTGGGAAADYAGLIFNILPNAGATATITTIYYDVDGPAATAAFRAEWGTSADELSFLTAGFADGKTTVARFYTASSQRGVATRVPGGHRIIATLWNNATDGTVTTAGSIPRPSRPLNVPDTLAEVEFRNNLAVIPTAADQTFSIVGDDD